MAWAAKKEVNISALIARPKSINLLGFWLEIKNSDGIAACTWTIQLKMMGPLKSYRKNDVFITAAW